MLCLNASCEVSGFGDVNIPALSPVEAVPSVLQFHTKTAFGSLVLFFPFVFNTRRKTVPPLRRHFCFLRKPCGSKNLRHELLKVAPCAREDEVECARFSAFSCSGAKRARRLRFVYGFFFSGRP